MMMLKSRPRFIITHLLPGYKLESEEKRVLSIGVWHRMDYQERGIIAIVIAPIS